MKEEALNAPAKGDGLWAMGDGVEEGGERLIWTLIWLKDGQGDGRESAERAFFSVGPG
jgi:hypothetical protein